MYVPRANAVADEAELRAMVAAVGSAQLITTGPDGYPLATLLPVLWQGGTVIAHFALANDHWRTIEDGAPALMVCAGPQAYISPSWYAAKAEHGRVVPTWNYATVHLTGTVRIHDDPDWVGEAVRALTERHEAHRPEPWSVTDAPAEFIAGQLRAIVGVELTVERAEGKAKYSQNRSGADRAGVVEGLRASSDPGDLAMADLVPLDQDLTP